MAYAHITYAQLQTELTNRLDDLTNVFWIPSEIQLYLLEALRTWQAFSHFWRGRMTFQTTANVPFYDLTAQAATLVPFTVTDTNLVSTMLFHLIEPQLAAGLYVGSDMFQLADFTKALERRRNQFLLEAGMVLTRQVMNWPAPPISRAALDDRTTAIRRVAWIDTNAVVSPLFRSDEWMASAFQRGWETAPAPTPLGYSVGTVPPVTLQIIPPPLSSGQVDLLLILTGATLNPSAGVLLGIPDDFSWVVKWGALSDMLAKAGEGRDMMRANYCQQRWSEGIALALMHTSAVQGLLDGSQKNISALDSFDRYNYGWQNLTAGTPTDLALASWNMLAVSPKPDANPHSITLDVVQNAPLPVNPGDFIQLGREELDVILDYAEHLAQFKIGGDEFMETVPLYQNMQRLAATYNETLKASIPSIEPMGDRSIRDEKLQNRRGAPQPSGG